MVQMSPLAYVLLLLQTLGVVANLTPMTLATELTESRENGPLPQVFGFGTRSRVKLAALVSEEPIKEEDKRPWSGADYLQEKYPSFDINDAPQYVQKLDEYRNGIRARAMIKAPYDFFLEQDSSIHHRINVENASIIYIKDKYHRVVESSATFAPNSKFIQKRSISATLGMVRSSRVDYSFFLLAMGQSKQELAFFTANRPGLIWGHQMNYLSTGWVNDDPINIVPEFHTESARFSALETKLAAHMQDEGATVYGHVYINYPSHGYFSQPKTARPASLKYKFTVKFPKKGLGHLVPWKPQKVYRFEFDNTNQKAGGKPTDIGNEGIIDEAPDDGNETEQPEQPDETPDISSEAEQEAQEGAVDGVSDDGDKVEEQDEDEADEEQDEADEEQEEVDEEQDEADEEQDEAVEDEVDEEQDEADGDEGDEEQDKDEAVEEQHEDQLPEDSGSDAEGSTKSKDEILDFETEDGEQPLTPHPLSDQDEEVVDDETEAPTSNDDPDDTRRGLL